MTPQAPDRHQAGDDTVGVVLAGGGSTRFAGGDKALATVDGTPIIARIADTLREATGRPPVVAVRSDERRDAYRDVLPGDVTFAFDAFDLSGPLAGVVGAAEATSAEWLFVCGCDMPLLSVAAVGWLLDRNGDGDAVAVRQSDGTIETLHAAYRREAVLSTRDRLPSSGGVRALFSALDSTLTIPPADAPPDVPLSASLSNVNTRADLEAARSRLAGTK